MTSVSLPPPPEPLLEADEVAELLKSFASQANTSYEATVDDLVTVRVGSSLIVQAVEILDRTLNPALKQHLETAIVGAMNTALQRAALAAGQAIGDLERKKKAGKTSV